MIPLQKNGIVQTHVQKRADINKILACYSFFWGKIVEQRLYLPTSKQSKQEIQRF